MTPFERAGYNYAAILKVLNDCLGCRGSIIKKGETVSIMVDDGTCSPKFQVIGRNEAGYILLDNLAKVNSMTYAEKVGLKIGDTIRHTNVPQCKPHFYFKIGEVLTFVEDDGSSSPEFSNGVKTCVFCLYKRGWEKVVANKSQKEIDYDKLQAQIVELQLQAAKLKP